VATAVVTEFRTGGIDVLAISINAEN